MNSFKPYFLKKIYRTCLLYPILVIAPLLPELVVNLCNLGYAADDCCSYPLDALKRLLRILPQESSAMLEARCTPALLQALSKHKASPALPSVGYCLKHIASQPLCFEGLLIRLVPAIRQMLSFSYNNIAALLPLVFELSTRLVESAPAGDELPPQLLELFVLTEQVVSNMPSDDVDALCPAVECITAFVQKCRTSLSNWTTISATVDLTTKLLISQRQASTARVQICLSRLISALIASGLISDTEALKRVCGEVMKQLRKTTIPAAKMCFVLVFARLFILNINSTFALISTIDLSFLPFLIAVWCKIHTQIKQLSQIWNKESTVALGLILKAKDPRLDGIVIDAGEEQISYLVWILKILCAEYNYVDPDIQIAFAPTSSGYSDHEDDEEEDESNDSDDDETHETDAEIMAAMGCGSLYATAENCEGCDDEDDEDKPDDDPIKEREEAEEEEEKRRENGSLVKGLNMKTWIEKFFASFKTNQQLLGLLYNELSYDEQLVIQRILSKQSR